MMAPRFLDTNLLLRYLTRDDERKAGAALNLLLRVERGEERVVTTVMVIFETIFTLQRGYKVSRADIQQQILSILGLRGLTLPNKDLLEEALELYARTPLSFVDAFNVVSMRHQGLHEIYSWDTDFDGVPGITRVEP